MISIILSVSIYVKTVKIKQIKEIIRGKPAIYKMKMVIEGIVLIPIAIIYDFFDF